MSSCRVEPRVDIDIAPDGSGVVRVEVSLDREALDALGDPTKIRTTDLTDAGWTVDPISPTASGLVFDASKPFGSRDDLPGVLAELAGPMFTETRLDVEDSWRETTYRFVTSVSSTGSPEQFSDADVAAALDGLALGRTPEELAASTGDEPTTMVVSVNLPGEVDGERSVSIVVAGGEPAHSRLAVVSEVGKPAALGWFLAAGTATVVAAGLALARRRPTPGPDPEPAEYE